MLPDVFEWQLDYIRSQQIPFIRIGDMVRAYGSSTTALADSVMLTADDGWADVMNALPILQARQAPMTLYIYPMVLNHGAYLKFAQLDALKANPWIDFGCHSYTHPVLRHVSAAVLKHEVLESKAVLEKQLGKPLDTFAYPFGMFDRATQAMVREHYKLGLGVNDGGNTLKTNCYNINRFVVYRTTGFGDSQHADRRRLDQQGHGPFRAKQHAHVCYGDP